MRNPQFPIEAVRKAVTGKHKAPRRGTDSYKLWEAIRRLEKEYQGDRNQLRMNTPSFINPPAHRELAKYLRDIRFVVELRRKCGLFDSKLIPLEKIFPSILDELRKKLEDLDVKFKLPFESRDVLRHCTLAWTNPKNDVALNEVRDAAHLAWFWRPTTRRDTAPVVPAPAPTDMINASLNKALEQVPILIERVLKDRFDHQHGNAPPMNEAGAVTDFSAPEKKKRNTDSKVQSVRATEYPVIFYSILNKRNTILQDAAGDPKVAVTISRSSFHCLLKYVDCNGTPLTKVLTTRRVYTEITSKKPLNKKIADQYVRRLFLNIRQKAAKHAPVRGATALTLLRNVGIAPDHRLGFIFREVPNGAAKTNGTRVPFETPSIRKTRK